MDISKTIRRRLGLFLQLTLIVFTAISTIRAAGEVDPTFNPAVQAFGGTIHRLIALPDGKVVVAGNFTVAGNSARSNIARLNADGTVDETFAPPDFYRIAGSSAPNLISVNIFAVAVQSDGKIVVGGEFDFIGNSPRTGAVRLNADGSLDASFNLSFATMTNQLGGTLVVVNDIKVQADNQVILGGNFGLRESPTGAVVRSRLARVNTDGSVDLSYTASPLNPVQTMVLQPDGKLIYADSTGIVRRVNTDGTLDNSFLGSSYNYVFRLVLQPDGKILLGGGVGKGIIRLNANGTVDPTFNPSGTGAAGTVRDIAVLPDGKIFIGGQFLFYNNVARSIVARLNADGTLDTTFIYTAGNIFIVYAVALLNDGGYLVGALPNGTLPINRLIRINADGTRDANYAGDVYMRGTVRRVVAEPDGKVLVGGSFSKVNGVTRFNIARLNQNGSLDTTFNTSVNNGNTNSFDVQTDGKIIVVGSFREVNQVPRISVARLNADGSLDTGFQTSIVDMGTQLNTSIINEAIQLPDGKILIAGRFRLSEYAFELNVARLNANGSTDTSFIVQPVNTVGIVRAMKIHTDGKIVVGGQFSQIAGANRGGIARLNADGSLDSTFNPSSGVGDSNIFDLAIQSNGSIIIGGDFIRVNGVANRFYLARLLPDGSLDAPFFTLVNNIVYAVERQADDKLLVGSFFNINGKRGIARFNTDGTLDSSFTGNGTNETVRDIFIQSDNNILIGGDFTRVNNISRVGVARLLNVAAPTRKLFDFDGDGRADISVFRPSNGTWYLQQSTAGFTGIAFGQSGDIITPADYDGDGKTDIAVFRPSNGVWYIQRSTQGFTGIQFGTGGDIPVPGDYDGDGKAELVVFRPSTGVWFTTQNPATNFGAIQFGQAGDKPVPADYDGDGRTDLAVFRPSNGVWYIQRSQLGFIGIAFGAPDDKLVPADYDGDGKADIAVFRPSTGYWYTSQNPATNFGAVLFGTNGDLPVPADYDGDGRADIAVFRPSNGVWYLQRSTQGFTGVLFGASEDKPIPNAFVR